MTEQNGAPAAWHGVPRPEGLDEALDHARGQMISEDETCAGCGEPLADSEGEGYDGYCGSCADQRDARYEPCAHCGNTPTVCASQAGERLCAEDGAREVRDGVPPQWDEDAPQWAEDGQLGPDGTDQAQAREDAAVARWEARQAEGPSLPGVWTPEDLRAVVLTAGEIADAYGTGVDSLDANDILSTRQRELLERAAQAFRAEGAEDEPAPASPAHPESEQATGADFDTAAQLAGHAMACCTSAIGPVCRHRTTPVADALQEVNYWQDKKVIVSHPSGDGELAALRRLADAVRSHGIGADLAARRRD